MSMQRLIGLLRVGGAWLFAVPTSTPKSRQRMEFRKVPGMSIAVLKDGKIDWARGYGVTSVESGKPVTRRDSFPGGIHQQARRGAGCPAPGGRRQACAG